MSTSKSNSAGEPDRKRPRSELDAELYVNHPSLYFDDGNVILQCTKTLFCVHRTLLAKHSPRFAEILNPVRGANTLRGCRHVVLDDDADDMEALLKTIYDGLRVDFPQLTIENFPIVAGILRLSTKYRLERLRADMIARLKQEWPYTLEQHVAKWRTDMQKLSRAQPTLAAAQGGELVPNPAYDPAAADAEDLIVHPAAVLALLRQSKCDDAELLAPLFYDLSRRTWQFGGGAVGHHLSGLSHADVERFVLGLARLRFYQAQRCQCPKLPGKNDHQLYCQVALEAFWEKTAMPTLVRQADIMSQPIEDWESVKESAARTLAHGDMCADCRVAVLAHMASTQKLLWNGMAATFGLQ